MDEVIVRLNYMEFRLLREEMQKRLEFVMQYPLSTDGDLGKRLDNVCRKLDFVNETQMP